MKIQQVKDRKHLTQDERKQQKIFLSQKHEYFKTIKNSLMEIKDVKNKIIRRDRCWFDFFCLVRVLELLYLKFEVKICQDSRRAIQARGVVVYRNTASLISMIGR